MATPWGPASLVERLSLPQRAGERRFSLLLELLETPRGERLVRFAYSTDGVVRRGPVTLRERDLERLRSELEADPPSESCCGSTAGVMLDEGGNRHLGGVDQGAHDQRAVDGTEERIDCVLRMRHQPEDVPRSVDYAGDIGDRAVRVRSTRSWTAMTTTERKNEDTTRQPAPTPKCCAADALAKDRRDGVSAIGTPHTRNTEHTKSVDVDRSPNDEPTQIATNSVSAVEAERRPMTRSTLALSAKSRSSCSRGLRAGARW